MKTYENIIASFKELLIATNFKKIKVTDICKKADISRKTFYTYFRDKEDVLEKIIFESISKPVSSLHGILYDYDSATTIILEHAFQALYDEKRFYEKVIGITGSKSVQEIIIEQAVAINLEILKLYNLPDIEKEYMAYFYAASYAMLISKWIKDKMVTPAKVMAAFYQKWALQYWKDLNSQYREISH